MNILLVDDDKGCRQSLAGFLSKCDHKVVACADGQDALEAFSAKKFHLVISDLKMPKISGIELLHRIRGMPGGPETDFVLFTGHGDMQTAIEALRAGAYDYLLKPVNIEELVSITEQVANRLALKQEHKILTGKFAGVVETATEETGMESSRSKKTSYKSADLGNVGIFSMAMREVFHQAKIIHADRSIPVLIEGETGTGKEVVAKFIHYGEGGTDAPFVDINCAAIAPGVFESELFGYEAGAFTGGLPKGQKGKLDLAAGGSILLDEIAEIPVNLQAKLLRMIQEKEFYRVGGLRKIKTDARIISATNVNIEKKVKEGCFRQDLYYRLNVGRIYLPPLRERKEDILPLAKMFLLQYAGAKKKRFTEISDEAAKLLLAYPWPGNVRELKNAMEWVVLMWDDCEVKPFHLGILHKNKVATRTKSAAPAGPTVIEYKNFALPPEGLPLEKYTNNIILEALKMNKGNKTKTARYLDISRRSLYCRLQKIEKSST